MPKFVFLAMLVGLAIVPAGAQDSEPAAGKFLVASRDLGDPNFSKTVILLLRYDEKQGAMGLVVNRRTDLPLSRVFQELKAAQNRTDEAYLGGPVEPEGVLALIKSPEKTWHILPPDTASVFDADPESVWPRLIRRTELRIASIRRLVAAGWLVDAHVVDRHYLRKHRCAIG
jgi:putative AlgH/UPF0301 family transcriptional regulator